MEKEKKEKRQYPYDGKTMFGMSVNGLVQVTGIALASQLFMVYLTDYSGIGPWGAVLAATVLFAGRIFDAANDPIQSWIMDSYRGGRYGKYKPFMIFGIVLMTVSVVFLYNLPSSFASNTTLAGVWVFFFYFLYDVGSSFQPIIPLLRSLTNDEVLRAKFLKNGRIVSTLTVIPMGMVIPIALVLRDRLGGIKNALGVLTLTGVTVMAAVSVAGIAMIKEGPHREASDGERIRFRDIMEMFRRNKPMLVLTLTSLFYGFIWTLAAAVQVYYIKWAYCADLTTGAVDNDRLALLTVITGLMAIMPVVIGTGFSAMMVKKLGSNLRVWIWSLGLTVVPYALLTVLQFAGALSLPLFVILSFLGSFIGNVGFVPSMGLWAEAVDYNRYKVGKEMGALVLTVRGLLEKGQSALAGGITGMVLIAVGYSVDSVTGDYLGNISDIPTVLNRFGVMMGAVPALLAAVSMIILKTMYPIDDKLRNEMKAALESE